MVIKNSHTTKNGSHIYLLSFYIGQYGLSKYRNAINCYIKFIQSLQSLYKYRYHLPWISAKKVNIRIQDESLCLSDDIQFDSIFELCRHFQTDDQHPVSRMWKETKLTNRVSSITSRVSFSHTQFSDWIHYV